MRGESMNKTKQDTIQLVKKYSAVTMLLFFVLLNSLFTPNFSSEHLKQHYYSDLSYNSLRNGYDTGDFHWRH